MVNSENINYLELVPVWLALKKYADSWKDCQILCLSDNTQVVHMLKKGHSINKDCMILLRDIFWLCVMNNMYITPIPISGEFNVIPDCLSRVSDTNSISVALKHGICCSEPGGTGR